MKIQSAINETKNKFGVLAKAGTLTLALVAAPAIGAAAYGATSGLNSDGDLCVVATRTDDAGFFASRGSCSESDLPAPGATPENPNPTPSPTPVETAPPVTVERASLTDVELYATDARKIILLNNGGFLENVAGRQIFITPSRGAAAKEIVGYPTGFLAYGAKVEANVSPDGKTIVVYTGRYAVVSFDGGSTWTPQKEAMWYDAEHQYVTSDVSADGKVVLLTVGRLGGGGFFLWLNADSGRQVADWKWTSLQYDQYSLDISGDGSTVSSSLYSGVFPKQSITNLNGPSTTSVNLSSYSWFRDFATSSDFKEQLRAMRDGSGSSPTYLFTSSDGGATMTKKIEGQFWSLGVSDNGVIQSAVRTHAPDNETGQLYMSFDSGENWKKMDVLSGATLGGVELAPDGNSLRIVTADSKTYFATVNP